MQGKDALEQRRTAIKACTYAVLLMFFFLFFGNLLMRLFDVPMSMIRVVGGVIVMRIGFELFAPSDKGGMIPKGNQPGQDVSFIPMAMPIMFGPGAMATVMGLTSTIKSSDHMLPSFLAAALAIIGAMFITCLSLIYLKAILKRVGAQGIDATTRIVGFFVAAMGVGMIFHGVVEFLQSYGVLLGTTVH